MYKEYPPDLRLQRLIETYWVADGVIEDSVTQRILPDGCVDIIFDFGSNNNTKQHPTGLPKLVGTMTSLLEISYQPGRVQMMGIRFAPAGITAFTRMPVSGITNQNIELPLAETLFDKSFYERLPDMECMQERIVYINTYFLARMHKLYLPDRQIKHAVSLIQSNNGHLSVWKIAGEVCLSERQFERKFKTTIGISPKAFSNIMRFRFVRRYMEAHPDESMYEIAIACGYHDHSHMNKEFQRLGSFSPSEYAV
ncbi:AraC-like DNA-binding protein [Parabacteroides sp. PF5-5]|uniref:AraC family transcriptional regulator n=1 Tax=unclassified Parabacteroides TaxID=2649774 RepID=UPI0024733206|nr:MULTISPECIES: helix-turn-helix domain-containing protein [unclassified Parabacteroides]MDH6305492.1 AraC-like DNA-binding protein [Parabacteroides sp. PH5-39]MDH6316242.1 AraC-like DNA-binding protein [Parabacteroides sp. PF5-13]MDH6320352.1 AraC-like DNA-binding protein [Parabacteroides sp. PH5-13]MDH6324082.1 AraC-like DNA-binding protein [Parabacteroides sp. PH5-8]MDH6329074.1 AraC-like DNA-binding protein [Parabacteroides sp. PH5-41]